MTGVSIEDLLAPAERSLISWTTGRIDAECEEAYEAYVAQVRLGHITYFAARPERRSGTRAFAACSREAAFPDGWEHLAGTLPEPAWHRYHLSAGSSQVLAIALIASATRSDPSLRWLPGDLCFRRPLSLFEVELAPGVLNERPRQTSLDWLVLDRGQVVAGEAKFTERGLGQCSCDLRESGVCSERVLDRPYWHVAQRDMALKPEPGRCSLSLAYQAVRNVAAAQAIAGPRRRASFLLLYDGRNPYFVGARAWPGWIWMLSQLTADSSTTFMALSWQELLGRVEFDSPVKRWAADKHGLVAGQSNG